MKNIIFVTELKSLEDNKATSTHIMSFNLLKGLKDNQFHTILVAICIENDDFFKVQKYYKNVVDQIICVKSRLGENCGKYKHLIKMLKYQFFSSIYRNDVPQNLIVDDFTLIISHSPSIEAIWLSNEIRKKYKIKKHFQYWSDPIAISGIYPENLNYKRKIFKFIEKKALKSADKVIYGTKILMQAQKKVYSKYQSKMYYIDISYIERNYDRESYLNDSYIYAGNYYSKIRNIIPTYNAFTKYHKKLSIYGNSDINLNSNEFVTICNRVTREKLKKLELEYSGIVCILNSNCIQIPGKIFYEASSDKKILVVLDGKYKDQIAAELTKYQRYYTCENNEEDIIQALKSMKNIELSNEYALTNFSPKIISKRLIDICCND